MPQHDDLIFIDQGTEAHGAYNGLFPGGSSLKGLDWILGQILDSETVAEECQAQGAGVRPLSPGRLPLPMTRVPLHILPVATSWERGF